MGVGRLFYVLLAAVLGMVAAPAATSEGPFETHPSWWALWAGPGRLGVRVQSMTPELRQYFGAPADQGVLVVRLEEGGPAAKAGVEVGDVIVAAGDEAIGAPHELRFAVAAAPNNALLKLEMIHKGEPRTFEVALRGEPHPVLDGETWRQFRDHIHPGIRKGAGDLFKHFEELERRLRELEQRIDQAHPEPSA